MKREDLTGKVFGRLTAIKYEGSTKGGQAKWRCLCECGNEKVVSSGHLKSGHTTSCGCYCRERTAQANTKHGDSHNRLYNIWQCIKARCYNQNHDEYASYGGRGISVCDEWLNSYAAFRDWSISSGYSERLTIDRIDVNGGYSPENCRWADRNTQSRNTRQNRYITIGERTMVISDWAKEIGVDRRTISARIDRLGWTPEDAVMTPVNQHNNH